jgi:hypothetical protein
MDYCEFCGEEIRLRKCGGPMAHVVAYCACGDWNVEDEVCDSSCFSGAEVVNDEE